MLALAFVIVYVLIYNGKGNQRRAFANHDTNKLTRPKFGKSCIPLLQVVHTGRGVRSSQKNSP